MNTVIALAPIALLVYLMTKKKSVPSHIALPLAAAILYGLQLTVFRADFTLMNATVINGLLTAWTPILVIGGAIFLFESMEYTGSLEVIRSWLNGISKNPVAQLMLVGWAFMFLVEGASGFGTPAALAAPLLVGLGFPPVRVAVMALIMNSVPVSFGAAGLPTWFGLGELGLSQADLIAIGAKTALIHAAASLIIPIIALRMVLEWKTIARNAVFIYLSLLGSMAPYTLLARVNYEFPSIVGGAIGLVITAFLAHYGIGLREKHAKNSPSVRRVIRATFPLWGTTLLLVLTRIDALGIKEWLNAKTAWLAASIPPLGDFAISPSLVLQWNHILGTESDWSHAVLFVPSILPFFAIGLLTFAVFKTPVEKIKRTWNITWRRMTKPVLALFGALVFVKLLMAGGEGALSMQIGSSLANLAGRQWQFFAPYLGALGAFFAGSNTVSNLTFGGIQQAIAQNLGLNVTAVLAMQSAGGAMGNMVCINNIVAVCAVLGLKEKEGEIMKKTVWPMLLYGAIAGGMGVLLSSF